MCDTIGKIGKNGNWSFFAKNSDRQEKEPQIMVYIPGQNHQEKIIKTTYIEIEQVEHTHAILISKPSWMWGAEMGVNDCGVCIGNEAVHTKGEYSKKGLLGMDLLRLALERANSAKMAVEIIIELLEKYGQGGNCGYEKEDYYDNSFLIMDAKELYVLETKDKHWAVQKKEKANISNCLSIKKADKFSDVSNFKSTYIRKKSIKSWIRTNTRKYLTGKDLNKVVNEKDIFRIMRGHCKFIKPFKKGTSESPCMHSGEKNEYQTTASMIVVLKEKPVIWFTACSLPCISIYKPYVFGEKRMEPIYEGDQIEDCAYWEKIENIHKQLAKKNLPKQFYRERDRIETNLIENFHQKDVNTEKILENSIYREKEFYKKWC